MKFHYCPTCGAQLTERTLGDEGNVPYCTQCDKPLFDMFSTCIIALVVNEMGEAALLRQNYISNEYLNLVSGYMKPGETAEQCARREILEELGLHIHTLTFAGTFWYEKKDMLMIGFFASVAEETMHLSGEVDSATWVPVSQALGMVHPEGSVSYSLVKKYLDQWDIFAN